MVDRLFLELDNPFDFGLETTADQEAEKKCLDLCFNTHR